MAEAAIAAVIWGMVILLLIAFTFFVFGAELPIYLLLAGIGFLVYIYSKNPAMRLIGGFFGRLFATLFIISVFYYFGTKTFFPDDPFNFRFLKIGLQFSIDFLNTVSNFIGKVVLNLINIIIP